MKAEELWAEFCSKRGIDKDTPYEAWGFGRDGEESDQLAKLVVEGKKFGTASLYDVYEAEDALDELPKVGGYSVILDSHEEAVCIIRDYDVYIRPFREVSPFHAYSEGEGDRSLEHWRGVHKEFFEGEAKECGVTFSEESKVVCEKFTLEYVAGCDVPEGELLFVEPTMNYADEIVAYRQEMLDVNSSFDGCFSMKRMPDPQEYVDYCIGWANPSREADVHGAWGNVLLVIRKADNKMVGCMQVHNVLTQRMKDCTGHVGYSVRPAERRRGYATKMLAKGLDFLSSFGFKEVVASCLPENTGSKKTILANGGEYIDIRYLESDDVNLERNLMRNVIRPHHGMCFQFYEGKGYDENFTDHMGQIIHKMEANPSGKIVVSATTDMVCANCPNNQGGVCESQEKVLRYDTAVLEACEIEDGATINYEDFISLVRHRVIDAGLREQICGDCEWNELCRR